MAASKLQIYISQLAQDSNESPAATYVFGVQLSNKNSGDVVRPNGNKPAVKSKMATSKIQIRISQFVHKTCSNEIPILDFLHPVVSGRLTGSWNSAVGIGVIEIG